MVSEESAAGKGGRRRRCQRRRGQQRVRGQVGITNSVDVNASQLRGTVEDRGASWAEVHGVAKCRTPLSG